MVDRRGYHSLIDPWIAFCALVPDPITSWEASYSHDDGTLPGLVTLLGPVAFLARFGDAETVERDAATLRASVGVLRKAFSGPGVRAETQQSLVDHERALRDRIKAARLAVRYLDQYGWTFDPKTRTIKERAPRRGRDLLTLCIQALSVEFGRDAAGREKIKRYLSTPSPIFATELDTGPRGNIAKAIERLKG